MSKCSWERACVSSQGLVRSTESPSHLAQGVFIETGDSTFLSQGRLPRNPQPWWRELSGELVAPREPSVPDLILRPQESQLRAGSVWSLGQASCPQSPHLSFGEKNLSPVCDSPRTHWRNEWGLSCTFSGGILTAASSGQSWNCSPALSAMTEGSE